MIRHNTKKQPKLKNSSVDIPGLKPVTCTPYKAELAICCLLWQVNKTHWYAEHFGRQDRYGTFSGIWSGKEPDCSSWQQTIPGMHTSTWGKLLLIGMALASVPILLASRHRAVLIATTYTCGHTHIHTKISFTVVSSSSKLHWEEWQESGKYENLGNTGQMSSGGGGGYKWVCSKKTAWLQNNVFIVSTDCFRKMCLLIWLNCHYHWLFMGFGWATSTLQWWAADGFDGEGNMWWIVTFLLWLSLLKYFLFHPGCGPTHMAESSKYTYDINCL